MFDGFDVSSIIDSYRVDHFVILTANMLAITYVYFLSRVIQFCL